jgi:hypothetical protein
LTVEAWLELLSREREREREEERKWSWRVRRSHGENREERRRKCWAAGAGGWAAGGCHREREAAEIEMGKWEMGNVKFSIYT